MSILTARGPTLRDRLLGLSQSTTAPTSLRTRRRRARLSPSRLPARLMFDWLEDLTLLSASILGSVQIDQGGGLSTGAPGVPGETVFLDLGHNHQDQVSTTVPATSLAFAPAPASLTGILGPTYMSSLPVQGLQPDIASLTVTMDVTNNSPDPITVAVISPVGLTVPDLPTLFQINPGEHFDGSFAMDAQTPITEATGSSVTGTYVPENFFGDPPAHVDGTDPNGTWGLVFIGGRGDITRARS